MTQPPAERSLGRWATFGLAALIFGLNAYIAFDLFRTEYLSRMDSIEGAYIGISRYIMDHGLHLDWFRQWYGGIPFQNTYPPLLHAVTAATGLALGISPALAHHAVGATFYCLGPVGLFFLALRLSKDWRIGFTTALAYSLLCPSTVVSQAVHEWASSPWDPARFLALVKFGDGPHVAAFALVPWALLAVDRALERTTPLRFVLAALACASVVLTNWLGASALALALVCYLLASSHHRPVLRSALTVGAIGVFAYAVAMPWIPPSTIDRISYNAQFVIGRYIMTYWHILYFAGVVLLVVPLMWILRKTRADILIGFGMLYALLMGVMILTWEKFEIAILPQPSRYHHELDFGLIIAAVSLGALVWRFILPRIQWPHTAAVACTLAAVLVFSQTKTARRTAREHVVPLDITTTIEYKIGTWFRDNLPNGRAFVSGSTQFWFTAFTDTSELGGGFGQGIVNPQIPIMHYGVPWTEKNAEDSGMWLRLYGASAVAVFEPGSRDSYAFDWRDPLKFRGKFPELFRDGSDVIYRVPLYSDSLAHILEIEQVVTKSPINNLDLYTIDAISKAFDHPYRPRASFDWTSNNTATIHGTLNPDQLLFVQISYHRGWHAYVGDEERPISREGLGQMLIEPGCNGACEVRLVYDGGTEMKAALAISWTAILGGLAAIVRQFMTRSRLNSK